MALSQRRRAFAGLGKGTLGAPAIDPVMDRELGEDGSLDMVRCRKDGDSSVGI